MSIVFSVGRWGGLYYSGGYLKRICLGWVALTFIPEDFDDWVSGISEYSGGYN